mgnify:CR=1 FL=1|tara:strand:- start:10128 stop:13019 length:2892 start_codon:yes stop_codon:yes gene_type:complete
MGFFVTFFIYAALFVLSELLRPKPDLENAKPAGLGDFQVPTATEGRPLPKLYGRVRLKGPNVIWYGDFRQVAITEEVKTGMFSSEDVIVGWQYFLGMQMALCEGELDDLTRIWITDKTVVDELAGTPLVGDDTFTIDKPVLFGGDEFGKGGLLAQVEFKNGSNTQAVSSYLSSFQKTPAVTGDTSAYRDCAYLAPINEPWYLGDSTSIDAWAIEVRRNPNQLALTLSHETVNDGDANPAACLYELLTDPDGYGYDVSEVSGTSFRAAGDTLFDEGNGFSFLLDRVEPIEDTMRRIEEQIDSIVYENPATGLVEITLIRDDYDVDTLLVATEDNSELESFTRGSWEGTSNQVRVPFNDRSDEYKDTYGFAQDMANVLVVGSNVSVTIAHPGVKVGALANSLAWRELRTLSVPMAQAVLLLNREFHDKLPGDIIPFTHATLDFVKLPMRIKAIDYGELGDGRIRAQVVQDVFRAAAGTFANPPSSGWSPPVDTLTAIPTDEQIAIEAPRALNLRAPNVTDEFSDRVFAAARKQGNEAVFRVRERHATPPTVPSGTYLQIGTTVKFALVGELSAALAPGSTVPLTSLLLDTTPDTQANIEGAFPDVADLVELGTELVSCCYIDGGGVSGGEFILCTSAQNSATEVQLNNVYRGVMDSVQGNHSAGARVYLVFVGASVSDISIPAGDDAHVILLPKSTTDELLEASANVITVNMRNRSRRPYPPSEFDIGGTRMDTTNVNLDGSGSGEDVGVLIDEIKRRDYRTIDELAALGVDAGVIFGDFPAANTTTHSLVCFNGTTELHVEGIVAATTGTLRQLDILQGLGTTSLPSSLTFGVRATHDHESTSYDSLKDCIVVSTIDSPLVGKHAFGVLDQNDVSTIFDVVSDTVDHDFTLSTLFTVGDVEYRLDGGAWTTLIAAGATTGTIPNASLSGGTDIEIRHTSTDVSPQKLLVMDVSGTDEAYAVLIS